jgi:hypothetical protein
LFYALYRLKHRMRRIARSHGSQFYGDDFLSGRSILVADSSRGS